MILRMVPIQAIKAEMSPLRGCLRFFFVYFTIFRRYSELLVGQLNGPA